MASVNKVSVSELPTSQEITDNDYLLVQEPTRTSRIKFTDFVIGQTNTSFYSEIVQLKSTIAVLSAIVAANSANWIAAHTTVDTNSGNWDIGYASSTENRTDISSISELSAAWSATATVVYASTGNWDIAYTKSTTDLSSVYTTVNTNSGSTW
tara:strand:+ start:700 stop:1158 length:459 start_codon:yes stop_codon:yes gene_type:complete